MASSLSSFSSSSSSLSSHPDASAAPEPAPRGPPGCQAIFHYHTCGCRTPRPVLVCRAPRCAHGGPLSVLVAPAPFACQSGRRAACAAADPAARSIQREEDTAYRVCAGDLVRLGPRAGLDLGALDAVVPRFAGAGRDWRAVVAERYARLRPGPPAGPGPAAELHADEAPVRAGPGNGADPPPVPSELAADASPLHRAPGDRVAAAYRGTRLGNADGVLAWLAAPAPAEPAESPLQTLLRGSEPLPSRTAPSSHDPPAPDDRIRRTPRTPGAQVEKSPEWSPGAKDRGSEGLSQPQKLLFGRGIITYFMGGLL